MIIGYARVSTQDQNPQLQRDALEEAGCEQVFEERVTATKRERPELQACLRTLRDGDTLVVWTPDRLARLLRVLVGVIHTLSDGVGGSRTLTGAIDTPMPGGKLVLHIFGGLEEFEHSLIREGTLAGLAAARARGRKGGRRPVMSAADVRKAAAMLVDPEITKTEVAKHFGVSRVTLNASLEREGLAKVVNHPQLEQLLAQCDPHAPELEGLRAWLEAPAVGREEL